MKTSKQVNEIFMDYQRQEEKKIIFASCLFLKYFFIEFYYKLYYYMLSLHIAEHNILPLLKLIFRWQDSNLNFYLTYMYNAV